MPETASAHSAPVPLCSSLPSAVLSDDSDPHNLERFLLIPDKQTDQNSSHGYFLPQVPAKYEKYSLKTHRLATVQEYWMILSVLCHDTADRQSDAMPPKFFRFLLLPD